MPFENIPSRKRPFFHYNKIFNRKNKLLSQVISDISGFRK